MDELTTCFDIEHRRYQTTVVSGWEEDTVETQWYFSTVIESEVDGDSS